MGNNKGKWDNIEWKSLKVESPLAYGEETYYFLAK